MLWGRQKEGCVLWFPVYDNQWVYIGNKILPINSLQVVFTQKEILDFNNGNSYNRK
jgi:hypothetical protein